MAIPNFSFDRFTTVAAMPISPKAPTRAMTTSSTSVATSTQAVNPTRTIPLMVAAMITASIDLRPCSDQ